MGFHHTAWTENRVGWLVVAWFDGFGARTLQRFWNRFEGDGAQAVQASREDLLGLGVTNACAGKFLDWRQRIDPGMFVRRCEAEQIRFILEGDPEFPQLLKHSTHSPIALFVKGDTLGLGRSLAVVDTRSMTPYGGRATELIVSALSQAGCDIISGLALGIDGKAHEAALSVNGRTVAVLPGGLDAGSIYPSHHGRLAQNILHKNGALVSEFPPGTKSLKHHFLLRNRLMACLSEVCIVVEAAEKSGSLTTAAFALEENREVFAVPGPITSEFSAGTNRLLHMGAHPCVCGQDVLDILETEPSPAAKGSCGKIPEGKPELTPTEHTLLQLLDRPLFHDEIIRSIEGKTEETTSLLTTLELKGLVEAQAGGTYVRTTAGKRAIHPSEH